MFGPNVTIRGGDHNTGILGRFMIDAKEKRPQDDKPVVIEEDVWVGTGAIILKGVVVGQGAIIGAGAVVTRSVAPYSIVARVPARHLRYRWSVPDIVRHEQILYPPSQRTDRAILDNLMGN